jgi:hypothetical protein
MQNEKKYFLSTDSMLDADSADFVVPQNAWVNMENARTGTTDAGVIGTVESIGSTELIIDNGIFDLLAIGMADDVENKRFVTFYYDESGNGNHEIQCCYTDTNTIYTVLKSSDVTGGLNFTSEPIHSAKIIGDILSWVNGINNEPRKINIESAIVVYDPTFQTNANPYTFPLNFSEITLIKRPPIFSPTISKQYNSVFQNNFIANESLEFAFQYTYYDNETSVTGLYSQGSRLNSESDNFNYINILMNASEKIPNTVKLINLIVRISDGKQTGGNSAFVAKKWDRSIDNQEIINHNSGISELSFDFYNNTVGEFVAEDDVLRQFDNVPIYSKTHEVAKNRYFLGNNTEGYDAPKATSLKSTIVYTNKAVSSQTYNLYTVTASTVKSPNVTGGTYSNLVYKAYYIFGQVLINNVGIWGFYEITSTVVVSPGYLYLPPPQSVSITDLVYRSDQPQILSNYIYNTYFNGFDGFRMIYQPISVGTYLPGDGTTQNLGTSNYTSLINVTSNDTAIFNSLPQISSYNTGIVFYDYAMRRCGVVDNSGSDVIKFTFNVPISSLGNGIIQYWGGSTLNNQIRQSLSVGQQIEISGGTAIDGLYTISYIPPVGGSGGIPGASFVVTNAGLPATNQQSSVLRILGKELSTKLRDFDYTEIPSYIQWYLDSDNQLNEIPEWAYYYSVVRTLNLRTRYFLQGYTDDTKWVGRDANGAYTVFSGFYNPLTTVGIAININALQNFGLGYSYSEGDESILTFGYQTNTINIQLPVIAQEGNYVIVKVTQQAAINLLSVVGNVQWKLIYELYTPYKYSEQEPYYEVGSIYSIDNPKTANRSYSVLSGLLNPDSYILYRNNQAGGAYVNTMSPNDRYYQRWDSDAGKINFITNLGQTENTTQISWSDTVVTGTKINGSSTFRGGNNTYVPDDSGAISKLILTSKVQEQGTVMLSICTNETNSMYLGETQITDSTGKVQFFGANASQVISTINTLKGSFGTVNPEAVTEFRGSVFYPDANRGVWVQYSSNGLFPISNYKMTRFWKLFFKRYLSAEGQQYMSINNIRPYLFSTVDASHLELLISIPEIYDTPPKGYLVDYPNEVYPFDIYDGKSKSIVFCLENTGVQPHWQGSYSFNPEQFMSLQNKLYSVKDGNLFQHNMTDSFNNFYGRQYTSKIMVVSNQLPQRPKVYNNVSVEANMKPIFVYFYNDYPYLQTSDLEDVDFRDLEGVYYATLYRNKIIDNGSGTLQTTALLTGEKMRNVAMKIMLEFDVTEAPLELKFLNIGYDISKGHTT